MYIHMYVWMDCVQPIDQWAPGGEDHLCVNEALYFMVTVLPYVSFLMISIIKIYKTYYIIMSFSVLRS